REITTELKESYLDYAMSVIVSRALPDVRDGLKPVHRRILYTMHELNLGPTGKTRKSAKIVGDVTGNYHPHGGAAVYEAMVKLAQDFGMRYPLVIGQGNFGSIDGDNPAAERYTEAKMSRVGTELLSDIEKETVDWRPNYEGTREEPVVLPASVPGLLLNGTLGIAVGMATNIPPHNLGEIIDATAHLIDDPKAASEDLLTYVKGPDFPGGGVIYNKKDVLEAYTTGKGPITMRGVAEIKEKEHGKGFCIEITQIPYQVNKSSLVMRLAELVTEKKIDGIRDIRDESTDEISIIIELKSDAVPQKVLNRLFKYTDMQKNFNVNMVALAPMEQEGRRGLQPQIMSLKDILAAFIQHRQEVIRRRTEFELRRAKERAHILEGLSKALQFIDKVIEIIKKSASREDAHKNL
ncbi:MAG: DNA gyrase subunit A, partial [Candidatus Harrisonbacteria bacterium CG10_big_fil_rev_8_21_14_0_10_49_15]